MSGARPLAMHHTKCLRLWGCFSCTGRRFSCNRCAQERGGSGSAERGILPSVQRPSKVSGQPPRLSFGETFTSGAQAADERRPRGPGPMPASLPDVTGPQDGTQVDTCWAQARITLAAVSRRGLLYALPRAPALPVACGTRVDCLKAGARATARAPMAPAGAVRPTGGAATWK
jgi:hypothetical protein